MFPGIGEQQSLWHYQIWFSIEMTRFIDTIKLTFVSVLVVAIESMLYVL